MYLEKINSPEDVKKLNIEEMKVLAEEIREAIIKRDAIHGGHFGPNLGMVEATIALHYVFDSPKDKFVFDVSHQSYPHKMLTGRREAFTDEAHYDDVTGYSNQHESEHDHFILGHTSTSISLALGLAKARDVKGEKGTVIGWSISFTFLNASINSSILFPSLTKIYSKPIALNRLHSALPSVSLNNFKFL